VTPPTELTRRDFVRAAAAAGAGLSLAVYFQGCADGAPPAASGAFAPDAFLRLAPDGQGPTTGLAMLVAEELDCDWSQVRFQQAPAGRAYEVPTVLMRVVRAQLTGESTSIRLGWLPMRQAGATARAMLVAAAAARWGVPASACRTASGAVHHDATGEALDYGALVADAAALDVPRGVPLKDPKEFRLIGRRLDRLDNPDKVRGVATFGLDVRLPGMAYASVERSPVFGGRVATVQGEAAARAVPGVVDVVRLEDRVAVVAEHYWQAVTGRRALTITWEEGAAVGIDSAGIETQLATLLDAPEGRAARRVGDAEAVLSTVGAPIVARYDLPYLAHATMEPMNCTAWVHDGRAEVWAPTQYQAGPWFLKQGGARGVAARAAGISASKVTINTTFLGGGFGRRLEADYVAEAVHIAKAANRPVQVVWSREDDVQHDFYRPVAAHALTAALGPDGMPQAWRHRMACQSILRNWLPAFLPDWSASLVGVLEHGADPYAVQGADDAAQPPGRLPRTHAAGAGRILALGGVLA